MMKFIYCAGGFGKEMMDIARRQKKIKNIGEDIFFIDDSLNDAIEIYQTRSYTFISALEKFSFSDLNHHIVIANGEPIHRKNIFDRIMKNSIGLDQLIDPSAIISDTAILGEGILVAPLVSIASQACLQGNVAINTMAIVGHDVQVGEHTVISSMVNLGGSSVIGRETYIGMGAQIKERVKIGNNSIVGMGAVVYDDIPDQVIALGNPARVMRKNTDQKVFK